MPNSYLVLSIVVVLRFISTVSGDVLQDNVVLSADVGFSDYYFKVFRQPPPDTTDFSFMFFDVEAAAEPGVARLLFRGTDLSEGSDWYLTEENEILSADTIASGAHELWARAPGPGDGSVPALRVPFGEFWLGINTGSGFEAGGAIPRRDMFGWAELFVAEDLTLQLRDSAIAVGGIKIGQNVVPEPANSFGLLLACIAAILFFRHKRRC